MLKHIWNLTMQSSLSVNWKYRCFLAAVTLLSALGGLVFWLLIDQFVGVNRVQWMICSIGYGSLFGFFKGMIHVFNNE